MRCILFQLGEESILKAAIMRPGDMIKIATSLAKLVSLSISVVSIPSLLKQDITLYVLLSSSH